MSHGLEGECLREEKVGGVEGYSESGVLMEHWRLFFEAQSQHRRLIDVLAVC